MVAKTKQPEKMIGGGGVVVAAGKTRTPISSSFDNSRSGSFSRPSWLLFNIADLDERMKMVTLNASEEENAASFADRAEGYYQRRPQLLALLHDLYNGYVSLGDRYCQALAKNQHRRRYSSPISPFHFNDHDRADEEEGTEAMYSDTESSLSYQTPFPVQPMLDVDMIVADLVIKSVSYEIVLNELNVADKRWGDSSRKIELQKSLLDVLESERLILLNENSSLSFRANALMEENKGLASESAYMKRKAAELARCMLQMREDHRVCLLSQKIEDLQGQVYRLEKRNKEYYDQLVKHAQENTKSKAVKSKSHGSVLLDDCFHVPEDGVACFGNGGNSANHMKKTHLQTGSEGPGRDGKALKLWVRMKRFNIFMCVPRMNSTAC